MRTTALALAALLAGCVYHVDPPFDGGPYDGGFAYDCGTGRALCPLDDEGGGMACVSLNEWAWCGSCDNRCAPREECFYGACRPSE